MFPTFCPPTIWAIYLEISWNPSILEAYDFLGACCRESITPKKLWTVLSLHMPTPNPNIWESSGTKERESVIHPMLAPSIPKFSSQGWEEPSMDQYQCRGKLLTNFHGHWSIQIFFKTRHQKICPYGFPLKFAWANGSQSSLKALVCRHRSIDCSSLQGFLWQCWKTHKKRLPMRTLRLACCICMMAGRFS